MNPNTGSFGAAIGGGDAIKQAMARRGLGGGATAAVSPAAATFNPATAGPSPVSGQAPAMVPGASQAPTAPLTPMGTAPTGDESGLIVKALITRLGVLSKAQAPTSLVG